MKKINITELLKDCPTGMELDCTSYDNVSFDKISDDKKSTYPIFCYITDKEGNRSSISFTENGYESKRYGAKCVIFPKGKTTWEGFVPPCKFKDGDVIYVKDKYNQEWCSIFNKCEDGKLYTYIDIYITNNNIYCNRPNILTMYKDMIEYRLATEEEKQKLFDTIKANAYKWNAKTKTLEKLPKSYKEEASGKFDIATLVPFESKVLVRDGELEKWCPAIWGIYDDEYGINYPYECVGGAFAQCIPYEGNEHLLGTNNECNKYYKTWK